MSNCQSPRAPCGMSPHINNASGDIPGQLCDSCRTEDDALAWSGADHEEACFFFVRLTLSRLSTCSSVCDDSMIFE